MEMNLAAGGPPAAELLAEAGKTGITIFDAGGVARSLAKALRQHDVRVAALVVTEPLTTSCDDMPVRSLATLEDSLRQLPMWIGVFNRESASDLSSLSAHCRRAGVLQTLLPQHYYEAVSNQLGWRFWLGDRKDYLRQAAAIQEAYSALADDESRRLFAATLAFRLAPMPSNPIRKTSATWSNAWQCWDCQWSVFPLACPMKRGWSALRSVKVKAVPLSATARIRYRSCASMIVCPICR